MGPPSTAAARDTPDRVQSVLVAQRMFLETDNQKSWLKQCEGSDDNETVDNGSGIRGGGGRSHAERYCIRSSPAVAHADPASCPATFNTFIPGTWEIDENADPNQPTGMLAPIAEAVEKQNGSSARTYTLPYMARAFDNGKTYADSKSDGLTKATAVLSEIAAKCSSTKFTITGYSQGADVAGDLASAIGNGSGPVTPERVLGVALLADPGSGTKGEAVVGPRAAGNGIADPRPQGMGKLSGRVASICDPKDLYCSINKGDNTLFGALGSILSKSPSVRTLLARS